MATITATVRKIASRIPCGRTALSAVVAALLVTMTTCFGDASTQSTASELLTSLRPHPVFDKRIDHILHKYQGSDISCSLAEIYNYVILRSHRPFSLIEFNAFRRWAHEQGLFNPEVEAQRAFMVVDFDALAARLPEFFGPSVQSLTYTLAIPMNAWAEDTAEALEAGRSVLAFTSTQKGIDTDADHVITVLDAVRGLDGVVVSFDVSDSHNLEATTRLTVADLADYLARPSALHGELAAIDVSTEAAYNPTTVTSN